LRTTSRIGALQRHGGPCLGFLLHGEDLFLFALRDRVGELGQLPARAELPRSAEREIVRVGAAALELLSLGGAGRFEGLTLLLQGRFRGLPARGRASRARIASPRSFVASSTCVSRSFLERFERVLRLRIARNI